MTRFFTFLQFLWFLAAAATAMAEQPSACSQDGECEAQEETDLKVSLLQQRGLASAALSSDEAPSVTEPSVEAGPRRGLEQQRGEIVAELAALDEELFRLGDGSDDSCGPPSAGCLGGIRWAKSTGIKQHPQWYPGLHSWSTDNEFQEHLAKGGHNGCQHPCGGGSSGGSSGMTLKGQVNSSAFLAPFLGIGYTPDPHKGAASPPCDDFMSDWSEPIWGPSGRDDLKTIKDMGANAVRTYGIGSHLNHKKFMDRAHEVGLKVMPGFADYPYLKLGSSCKTESVAKHLPVNCIKGKDHNCYNVIKAHYKEMLLNGHSYVDDEGKRRYHPAISTITVINECELKLMYNNRERLGQDANHAKVVASATDGLRDAEKELGIVGDLPMLTATASYAACRDCKSVRMGVPDVNDHTPFLPFVLDYYFAFKNPQGYIGYHPKNNLTEIYMTRWVNSFNTPRPAHALCDAENQALKKYTLGPLGKVPIYIGEFHHHSLSPKQFGEDVAKAKAVAENKDGGSCGKAENPLVGFNLFEFQVSYWKGAGSEGGTGTKYGMWGLGNQRVARTHTDSKSIGYQAFDVPCIYPAIMGGRKAQSWEDTNVKEVLKALGGKLPPHPKLCY